MPPHVDHLALAWLEGTLSPNERERVDRHLAECGQCKRELERMRLAWDALADWSAGEVPAALSARILKAHSARARWLPVAWVRTAATVLLAFGCGAIGWWAGARSTAPGEVPAGTQFLLLLEEPEWPPPAPLGSARDGYTDWARALRDEQRLVSSEKLTEEPGFRVAQDGRMQPAGAGMNADGLSGWFLVRAESYEQAAEIVRRGPHLRHGPVLIRQIE